MADVDETLLNRPGFDEVARLLDQGGVSSAVVTGGDTGDPTGRFDARELSSDLSDVELISEPFSCSATGSRWATTSAESSRSLCFFGDDDTAERARVDVEDRWTGNVWYRDEVVAATDLFTVLSSERSGTSVVVTVAPKDDGTTARIGQMLASSSLHFFITG